MSSLTESAYQRFIKPAQQVNPPRNAKAGGANNSHPVSTRRYAIGLDPDTVPTQLNKLQPQQLTSSQTPHQQSA